MADGLAGGALVSAVLCSFASPYTLVLGLFALLLAWLVRGDHRLSLGHLLISAR